MFCGCIVQVGVEWKKKKRGEVGGAVQLTSTVGPTNGQVAHDMQCWQTALDHGSVAQTHTPPACDAAPRFTVVEHHVVTGQHCVGASVGKVGAGA